MFQNIHNYFLIYIYTCKIHVIIWFTSYTNFKIWDQTMRSDVRQAKSAPPAERAGASTAPMGPNRRLQKTQPWWLDPSRGQACQRGSGSGAQHRRQDPAMFFLVASIISFTKLYGEMWMCLSENRIPYASRAHSSLQSTLYWSCECLLRWIFSLHIWLGAHITAVRNCHDHSYSAMLQTEALREELRAKAKDAAPKICSMIWIQNRFCVFFYHKKIQLSQMSW